MEIQHTQHHAPESAKRHARKATPAPWVPLVHVRSVTATVDPGSDYSATKGLANRRRWLHQIQLTTREKEVCACVFIVV